MIERLMFDLMFPKRLRALAFLAAVILLASSCQTTPANDLQAGGGFAKFMNLLELQVLVKQAAQELNNGNMMIAIRESERCIEQIAAFGDSDISAGTTPISAEQTAKLRTLIELKCKFFAGVAYLSINNGEQKAEANLHSASQIANRMTAENQSENVWGATSAAISMALSTLRHKQKQHSLATKFVKDALNQYEILESIEPDDTHWAIAQIPLGWYIKLVSLPERVALNAATQANVVEDFLARAEAEIVEFDTVHPSTGNNASSTRVLREVLNAIKARLQSPGSLKDRVESFDPGSLMIIKFN